MGAQAQPWMAVITALVIVITMVIILRRRRRIHRTEQAPAATERPADPVEVELEHGAALRENMERMRKEAPFRRRNG